MYTLINTTEVFATNYSSNNLPYVIHEYLSEINKELGVYVKQAIMFEDIQMIQQSFNHMYITESTRDEFKKYVMVTNLFKLDFETFCFKNINNNIVNLSMISIILDQIKLKTELLLDIEEEEEEEEDDSRVERVRRNVVASNNFIEPFRLLLDAHITNCGGDSCDSGYSGDSEVEYDSEVEVEDDSEDSILCDTDPLNTPDKEDLEKYLQVLKLQQLEEELRIKEEEEELEKDKEQYFTKVNKLSENKKLLKLANERALENRRVFASDVDTYNKIKKDYDNKVITDIPELFAKKYTIFDLMSKKDILFTYDNYILCMDEFNASSIPSMNDVLDDISESESDGSTFYDTGSDNFSVE